MLTLENMLTHFIQGVVIPLKVHPCIYLCCCSTCMLNRKHWKSEASIKEVRLIGKHNQDAYRDCKWYIQLKESSKNGQGNWSGNCQTLKLSLQCSKQEESHSSYPWAAATNGSGHRCSSVRNLNYIWLWICVCSGVGIFSSSWKYSPPTLKEPHALRFTHMGVSISP